MPKKIKSLEHIIKRRIRTYALLEKKLRARNIDPINYTLIRCELEDILFEFTANGGELNEEEL